MLMKNSSLEMQVISMPEPPQSNNNNIGRRERYTVKNTHIQTWKFFVKCQVGTIYVLLADINVSVVLLWSEQWKSQAMSTLWGEPGFLESGS